MNKPAKRRRIPKYQTRSQKPITLSNRTGQRFGRSGFDMTADNRHTANHYADATNGDINSIISNDRKVMQNRTRYEVRNNCILRGIRNSFVNEIVGTGPTLQMTTGYAKFDNMVENLWKEYASNKDLCDAGKRHDYAWLLRTGLKDTATMGEDLTTYRTIQRPGVTMAIQAINPLRLDTPMASYNDATLYDGVRIDPATTAPTEYYILKHHPGGAMASTSYEVIPASQMIHFFLDDESEQFRGFPTMAPALPLAAALRRYTMAVVAAAEQAANISGVVTSSLGQIDPDLISAMDEIEIARNALLTMPQGYDIKQFKAEQPTSTYAAFKTELVNEIGRCVFMPYIVAGGNAQGYNYSSGRLDLQDWWKATGIVQDSLRSSKVEPTFQRWFNEARLIPGFFGTTMTAKLQRMSINDMTHQWNWPGHEHVDPSKEANAQTTRLENKTTTLSEEWSKRGKDWERGLEQLAKEEQRKQELEEQYGLAAGTLSLVTSEAVEIINTEDDDNETEEEK